MDACWRRLKLRLSPKRPSEPKQVEDLRRDTLKNTTESYRVTIDDDGRHVARTQLLSSACVSARLVFCCMPVVTSLNLIFRQETELEKEGSWKMPSMKWRFSGSCPSLSHRCWCHHHWCRRHRHRRRRRHHHRRDVGEANVIWSANSSMILQCDSQSYNDEYDETWRVSVRDCFEICILERE